MTLQRGLCRWYDLQLLSENSELKRRFGFIFLRSTLQVFLTGTEVMHVESKNILMYWLFRWLSSRAAS